ncbi:MAG: hypothetical protein HQ526_11035 [Actinobacteria bacterium]|nr:hypothetical protein [Actinomycetota bacterium]
MSVPEPFKVPTLPYAPPSHRPNGWTASGAVSKMPRPQLKPFRLTDRDEIILSFLIRYGVATYAQLARLCATKEDTLRHRLSQLRDQQLISIEKSELRFNLVTATREAASVCGMTVPGPSHTATTRAHMLALGDAGIKLETTGWDVVTDRQLVLALADLLSHPESADGAGPQLTSYGTCDPNMSSYFLPRLGTPARVVPDLVVRKQPDISSPGSAIAVEVQLSRPSSKRLESTIAAYTRDAGRVFSSVVYVAPYRDVRHTVEIAVRRSGAKTITVTPRL